MNDNLFIILMLIVIYGCAAVGMVIINWGDRKRD